MTQKPCILITNDDGIEAEGLNVLADALEDIADPWVVAPAKNQSSVSSAISLRESLRVDKRGERRYAVTGRPADSVYVAANHLIDGQIDLCVSGINHGANLADDILYSGTVGGAIEAAMGDIPAIAVSLAAADPISFEPAAEFATSLAKTVLAERLPRNVILNVNVPREVDETKPPVVRRLGRRNYYREVHEKTDPRGRSYFWLGGSELGFDDVPGSDCNAIARSQISVTPLDLDMTNHRFMQAMQKWDPFDEETLDE
jgi:5'-nucleotidase